RATGAPTTAKARRGETAGTEPSQSRKIGQMLRWVCCSAGLLVAGCSSSSSHPPSAAEPKAASSIKHLVVLIQENHSFDTYFAGYCTAPTGSNPTCTTGPSCCETAPAKDPGSGMPPVVLDDMENATWDPNHTQVCEL